MPIKETECSKILKHIISEYKLNQLEIAKRCGMYPAQICNYVNGKSTPIKKNMDKIRKLEHELHISVVIKDKKVKQVPTHHKDTKNDVKRNGSGYFDPTAFEAIKKVDSEKGKDADRERLTKLLDVIFSVCDMADFHVEGRIILKDKRTGKVWR